MVREAEAERKVVLRCYAVKEREHYYGECIDLDIAVSRDSLAEAVDALNEAIEGHIQGIVERGWDGTLIPRPSPLRNRLRYHLLFALAALQSWRAQSYSFYSKEQYLKPAVA